MWSCPKCGESIEDNFDACWNCGTGQDGTAPAPWQPEPRGSEDIDRAAELQAAQGTAEEPGAGFGDAHMRIVELCSAANIFEAYAMRNLLDAAGIRCRVVGELLANAAGDLPLGQTIAPRIWVREQDVASAREIIDEGMNRLGTANQ